MIKIGEQEAVELPEVMVVMLHGSFASGTLLEEDCGLGTSLHREAVVDGERYYWQEEYYYPDWAQYELMPWKAMESAAESIARTIRTVRRGRKLVVGGYSEGGHLACRLTGKDLGGPLDGLICYEGWIASDIEKLEPWDGFGLMIRNDRGRGNRASLFRRRYQAEMEETAKMIREACETFAELEAVGGHIGRAELPDGTHRLGHAWDKNVNQCVRAIIATVVGIGLESWIGNEEGLSDAYQA